MRPLWTLSFWLIVSASAISATIYVPDDYATIQEAVDAAAQWDLILVAEGTYYENIDFKTQEVVVQSIHGPENTVIDGGQNGSVVTFSDFVDASAMLDGFTLTNGSGVYDSNVTSQICGGGISCFEFASPRIHNNVIVGNTAELGGGICCVQAIPEIKNNTVYGNDANTGGGIACHTAMNIEVLDNIIHDNSAADFGGGMHFFLSQAVVTNNLVYENSAETGGGIDCQVNGDALITNCTVTANTADLLGGGLHSSFSAPVVKNCIFWDDDAPTDPEISINLGSLTITYSDVEGGWADTGNIDADPLFLDAASRDYRLQQDPCQPGIENPCVDTGDPGSDLIVGTTRSDYKLDEDVVDMGFHKTGVLLVPETYYSIQQAIAAASRTDIILVGPGTYLENLNFLGKIITIISSDGAEATVIDGHQADSVVRFESGEGTGARIDGFTLCNGDALKGGGVYCVNDSKPEIINCILEGNNAERGGGIYCETDAFVRQNRFFDNYADEGGGIFLEDANPIVESNIFADNDADAGAGLYCSTGSSPRFLNCTVYNNTAVSAGGGLFCVGSDPEIVNSIFWVNSALFGPEINIYAGTVDVSYSCFTAGWTGDSNLAGDPEFFDAYNHDFSLLRTSQCINRGTHEHLPELDADGKARVYMNSVDMGALERSDTLPLEADLFVIPESTGNTINFTLDAGMDKAFRTYFLLGSVTGTIPGHPLPGGVTNLRLNWDLFTDIVVALLNTPMFAGFLGDFDAFGQANAQLLTGPLPAGYAGLELNFGYCLGWHWEYVSNPVRITVE